LGLVEAEVGGAAEGLDRRGRDVGDVGVQLVGGVEQRGWAPGAAVGQQQALDDLVGPVGAEHVLGSYAVLLADGLAHAPRLAVGVAVPADLPDRIGQRVDEAGWRWVGALVGVEADVHLDLGRVVALQPSHANLSRSDRAWAVRPSASAMRAA